MMIRKKISILALFVGAMLLLTATGVLAASPVTSDSHPAGEEAAPATTISPTVSITNPVAWAIGNFFSSLVFSPTYTVTVQSVLDFHAGGMGYGEIARCFFVAHSAGVSPDDVLAMRQGEGDEKAGWGEIMREYGFRPGKDSNLGAIRSERVITGTHTLTDTVEAGARPGRGPKETPPGWEHGKGLGRDKDKGHGRGHNK
jgi:hypothetical protein